MVYHNFHILSGSSYPFMVFLSLISLFTSFLVVFKYGLWVNMLFSFLVVLFLVLIWALDVWMEVSSGYHSYYSLMGLKLAFWIFVFSEFMFFVGIFWSFFDSFLVPGCFVGMLWGCLGLLVPDPFGLPLLNTVILLSSGVLVTYGHMLILEGRFSVSILFYGIVMGLLFLVLQFFEYYESSVSFSDGIYGSIFYLSTGFHGLHVFCGVLFLSLNLGFLLKDSLDGNCHLGLESAIVYWHFVDVVWIFLYLTVYWWSF